MAGLERKRARRGSLAKQQFARDLRDRMTPAEQHLWARLRTNQLGIHFRAQHPLFGFIVDFYAHRARLVVEIDGPIHESHVEADAQRDAILQSNGLTVLRFTNAEVMERVSTVKARILATCQKRTALQAGRAPGAAERLHGQ